MVIVLRRLIFGKVAEWINEANSSEITSRQAKNLGPQVYFWRTEGSILNFRNIEYLRRKLKEECETKTTIHRRNMSWYALNSRFRGKLLVFFISENLDISGSEVEWNIDIRRKTKLIAFLRDQQLSVLLYSWNEVLSNKARRLPPNGQGNLWLVWELATFRFSQLKFSKI